MKNFLICLITGFILNGFTPKTRSWVAIGDSITYLNDHQNETGNRVTKGYLSLITEELPQIKYINKGYNGWTAGGIAKEIETLGLTKADVYTIFLGTNDWWQGRPLGTLNDYKNNTGNQTFYGSYRLIIDKLRQLNKKAPIILITPMQRGDFVYIADMKNNAHGSYKPKNGQNLVQFAQAINHIGNLEKLTVVDLYNASGINQENLVKFKRLKNPQTQEYQNYPYPNYINIPFNPLVDEYPYPPEAIDMTYDGLHPSNKGYAVIAKMLKTVIKKELKIIERDK